MTSNHPPKIPTWILKHFGSGPDNDALLGDLAEQYLQKPSAAWYWRQSLKAVPLNLFREIRAHKQVAARGLLTGWGLWIVSLLWFFPFLTPYFFDLHGNGISAEFSLAHPIASLGSILWMPVGAPFSIEQGGILHVPGFLFSVVLPFITAALCGWLVARFHREQRTAIVLLFAGSIVLMNLLLFAPSGAAYLFLGPLVVYVTASVLGVLLGGGLLQAEN